MKMILLSVVLEGDEYLQVGWLYVTLWYNQMTCSFCHTLFLFLTGHIIAGVGDWDHCHNSCMPVFAFHFNCSDVKTCSSVSLSWMNLGNILSTCWCERNLSKVMCFWPSVHPTVASPRVCKLVTLDRWLYWCQFSKLLKQFEMRLWCLSQLDFLSCIVKSVTQMTACENCCVVQ